MPANPTIKRRHPSFWLYELPFSLVLVLTIFGVAYETFSRQPIRLYWEVLAPFLVLVCVSAGWHNATDKAARLRLVVSQALHWLAFLIVINLMLLEQVQRNFSANATGLAILTLLALGTFTAGLQLPSWQVCVLGLIMALVVPALAWIENSALFFLLISIAVVGLAVVIWWHWHERRERSESAQ
jgi:Flp pilus assembly protein TadB